MMHIRGRNVPYQFWKTAVPDSETPFSVSSHLNVVQAQSAGVFLFLPVVIDFGL